MIRWHREFSDGKSSEIWTLFNTTTGLCASYLLLDYDAPQTAWLSPNPRGWLVDSRGTINSSHNCPWLMAVDDVCRYRPSGHLTSIHHWSTRISTDKYITLTWPSHTPIRFIPFPLFLSIHFKQEQNFRPSTIFFRLELDITKLKRCF